jgi:hypothetical protein
VRARPLGGLGRLRPSQGFRSAFTPNSRSRLSSVSAPGRSSVDLAGPSSTIFRLALEGDNLVLAGVTAREIGRVTAAALATRQKAARRG